MEFYPENAEIEFRIAGIYFLLHENEKATYHLTNAIRFDAEHIIIIDELFPSVAKSPFYINALKKFKLA